jgi:hypothetical protein
MRTLTVDNAPAIFEQEEDVVTKHTGGNSTDEERGAANHCETNGKEIPPPADPTAGHVPERKEGFPDPPGKRCRNTFRR